MNDCNLKCTSCTIENSLRKNSVMHVDKLKKIVDEIADLKLLGTDGHISPFGLVDPLLHPQANEIFKYMKRRDLKVFLNTDGSFLTPDKIPFLYDIGIDRIVIKLCRNRGDFLSRGYSLSYEEYLKRILSAVSSHDVSAHRTRLELIVTVERRETDFSWSSMESLNVLLDHFGINAAKFQSSITDSLSWKLFRRYSLPIVNKEIMPGVHIAFNGIHALGDCIETASVRKALIGSCNALRPNGQIAILADGTYSLCCLDYQGRLKLPYKYDDCTFSELHKKKKLRSIKFQSKTCRLPFEFCRFCKGDDTTLRWFFNKLATCVYYNIPGYQNLRSFIYSKKS